jgi:hypothetical protein
MPEIPNEAKKTKIKIKKKEEPCTGDEDPSAG